jgi:Tc5 transposase DNA-binding domain
MDYETRMQAAISDLESQDRTNFAATAKRWDLERTTLAKRYRGQTGTREDAASYTHRKLSDIQEAVLIKHINKLSDRGLPPTPQLVKNIAEEIIHAELGPNWVSRFCKRHQAQLKSVYLRSIDHKRKIADNSVHFQHFFETVCICYAYISLTFHL